MFTPSGILQYRHRRECKRAMTIAPLAIESSEWIKLRFNSRRILAMNIEASSSFTSPVSQPDILRLPAPRLGISHHVKGLVPVSSSVDNNAHPALDIATPARIGILFRVIGSSGPRQQEEKYITDLWRAVGPDADHASPREEQRFLQLPINAESAEQRKVTFRMETDIAGAEYEKSIVRQFPF